MTDTETDGPIHQFWVGQGTMYGCLECRRAGDTPEDIDHSGTCSQFSRTFEYRTQLTVRFFSDSWNMAEIQSDDISSSIRLDDSVIDVWRESLEVYGPQSNQPWMPEGKYDQPPSWGTETRRFRFKMQIVLEAGAFGDLEEITTSWIDDLESSTYIENAHVGTVHNRGEVDE